MDARAATLEALAELIGAAEPRPLRVGIDGPDAAGKTTLAAELEPLLAGRGMTVARASVDDFLRPPAERYLRGRESPEGYYLDAFDVAALREHVLAPRGDVLLVDGVFLQRPELADLWHMSVFVHVEWDELLRRALARDGEAARRLYEARYLPAQRRYLTEVEPDRRADVVLDNTYPERPVLRH